MIRRKKDFFTELTGAQVPLTPTHTHIRTDDHNFVVVICISMFDTTEYASERNYEAEQKMNNNLFRENQYPNVSGKKED